MPTVTEDVAVTCAGCGRRRDGHCSPAESLAWMAERGRDALRWFCPSCVRTNVRAIEGKLPVDYW